VRSGGSPLAYLASTQAADGHYRYSSSSDQTPVWVTGQALLAVNGAAFPLSPVARAVSNPAPAGTGSAAGGGSSATAGAGAAPQQGGAKQGGKGSKRSPKPEVEGATVTAQPVAATTDDSGIPTWVVLVGFAVAAAAVWGGWLMYRRRLP
jgi:cobalamin biosynthesis Mg chelatase CobN